MHRRLVAPTINSCSISSWIIISETKIEYVSIKQYSLVHHAHILEIWIVSIKFGQKYEKKNHLKHTSTKKKRKQLKKLIRLLFLRIFINNYWVVYFLCDTTYYYSILCVLSCDFLNCQVVDWSKDKMCNTNMVIY